MHPPLSKLIDLIAESFALAPFIYGILITLIDLSDFVTLYRQQIMFCELEKNQTNFSSEIMLRSNGECD